MIILLLRQVAIENSHWQFTKVRKNLNHNLIRSYWNIQFDYQTKTLSRNEKSYNSFENKRNGNTWSLDYHHLVSHLYERTKNSKIIGSLKKNINLIYRLSYLRNQRSIGRTFLVHPCGFSSGMSLRAYVKASSFYIYPTHWCIHRKNKSIHRGYKTICELGHKRTVCT